MIHDLLATHHGVVSTTQLIHIGLTKWDIQQLVDSGRLTRVRRGWFARPTATGEARRAVANGGALSCISALRLHGLWTPPFHGLHVRRTKHHSRFSLDCRPFGPLLPVRRSVDPIGIALLAAARCQPIHEAVVLLDSALNLRKITQQDLVDLLIGQPKRVSRLLSLIDTAESGTETYVRLRLRSRGIKLRPQFVIPGIGRVDFLVGERLVIEADSRSHHDNPEAYHRDRLRDRRLRTLNFNVVRLTYGDVMNRATWAAAESDLLAQIRRGDHRWPRTRIAQRKWPT